MPVNEASEILALSLIFVVHVAGGLALVWGMLEGEGGSWWRRRRDDGPGGPPSDPPPPSGEPTTRSPLPLPGADSSPVRLRDETPLRDGYDRPPRRPQRTPDHTPSRR